ncbi:PREDICTED: uncharacterized protein LOC104804394 [Tarenaya hassleriana]|uniref:uncharacterized protein LOC104804394 n=1 Tax=Tarenaya hassleriana TaxID=28532 RepID=UPI00053C823B|nr:PREDICTED: uncharacterized protein LOC104804394 [Tarenaya hassleriana]
MGSDQSFGRLDTLEIKALIFRKIGHQRAEKYFDQLSRFLTLRVSKSEFDRFCFKTIGRENIPLHNRLIRSIIKNASVSKSPPLGNLKRAENNVRSGIWNQRNVRSLYGDCPFPPSPRKCRSRKFRDRPSPLGPLGKPQSITTTNDESMSKGQSATDLLSPGSRPPMEVGSVEEGEEVEQMTGSPSVQSRSPITAPLGVSINLRSGARKSLSNASIHSGSINHETCHSSGELPDTRTLRSRLERKLEMEGLRISMDSANLLNNGLDAFLRRLIAPCLNFARSQSGNEPSRDMNSQFIGSGRNKQQQPTRRLSYLSMLDFRSAMELNPQVLGEEWPIHLEKICSRASESEEYRSCTWFQPKHGT